MDRETRQQRFASHRPQNTLSAAARPLIDKKTVVLEPVPKAPGVPTTPTTVDYDDLRARIAKLSSSPATPPLPPFRKVSLPDTVSTRESGQRLSELGDSSSLFSFKVAPSQSPNVSDDREPPFGFGKSRQTPATPFVFGASQSPYNNKFGRSHPLVQQTSSKITLEKMVVEREPSKAPLSPSKPSQQNMGEQRPFVFGKKIEAQVISSQPHAEPLRQSAFGSIKQPEFGKASPLQNRLQPSVFNIPKPHQTRPEHHRPAPAQTQPYPQQRRDVGSTFIHPFGPWDSSFPGVGHAPRLEPDVVEIPRPGNARAMPIYTAPQPVYPAYEVGSDEFASLNPYPRLGGYVALTDQALFDDRFGASDPYEYVDTAKANENIKALLEGAFDDDEDELSARGLKKKREAAVTDLADKLKSMDVQNNTNVEIQEAEDNEDEDDGTIEGLNVKLLPHQVDGVAWMKDKEIGLKKKKKLPKGGILADDVCDAMRVDLSTMC